VNTNSHPIKLAIALALSLAAIPTASAQQAYPSQQAAADALIAALGTQKADAQQLAALLGKDWATYIPTEGVDRADVEAFLSGYRTRHSFESTADGKAFLSVGKDGWKFPIPLAKSGAGWKFDTRAGAEVIRERRIGRNELATLESVRAYNDAQMEYAELDRDGDGVLEYAQKILSADGKHDGLYWSDDDSGEISPLGPLFADASSGSDWHGYHYRILTAQGPSAPGGAYSYKIGDDMSRGFALVAWPSRYGDTGVMSFMISHDGQVFEKDLGPGSEKIAKAMTKFDPDSSWKEEPESPTAAASPAR
jgi:hypothetical protein